MQLISPHYSAHVYFEPGLCWNEPISILGYRGSSLDLFMVTQTHFQWWFQGRKWIVKKLLHFYEIYQPSKKGHTNFGTPRSLEPFLVGFEQKSFCQNVFYNHQVGQPRNFYQNSSTLIKLRGKVPKFSHGARHKLHGRACVRRNRIEGRVSVHSSTPLFLPKSKQTHNNNNNK